MIHVSHPDACWLLASGMLAWLDLIWFSFALRRFYPYTRNIRPEFGLAPWFAMGMGLAAARSHRAAEAALFGAALGAIVFASFNGTEAALRDDWRRPRTWAVDTLWGVVSCAAVCTVTHNARRSLGAPAIVALGAVEVVALACVLSSCRLIRATLQYQMRRTSSSDGPAKMPMTRRHVIALPVRTASS